MMRVRLVVGLAVAAVGACVGGSAFAQKKYVDKYGKDWPKGALEAINAIK